MSVEFKLEEETDPNTGSRVLALVQYKHLEAEDLTVKSYREVWCSIDELNTLFDACVQRWGGNWDLNKLLTAVRESEID